MHNDYSCCNHDHTSDFDTINNQRIDSENFQHVKAKNDNLDKKQRFDISSFISKWIFVIIVYILFLGGEYYNFTVKFI